MGCLGVEFSVYGSAYDEGNLIRCEAKVECRNTDMRKVPRLSNNRTLKKPPDFFDSNYIHKLLEQWRCNMLPSLALF